MATDFNKTEVVKGNIEEYSGPKKPFNNRKKSKPKNQKVNYDTNSTNNYNHVVITTGPNGNTIQVEVEEECPDDTASMCSSHSSGASEHSIGANKKTKKVRRIRCEIHSRKSKKDTAVIEECEPGESKNMDNIDNKDQKEEKRPAPVCTCSKSKNRLRRPEPEGGVLPGGKGQSHSAVLSELDQILFSSEPLFSDLEEEKEPESSTRAEDGEDSGRSKSQQWSRTGSRKQDAGQDGLSVDEQVKKESDRFHTRLERSGGGVHIDTTFSSMQMLSTNTSIKFAILQTELKNIKDRSLKRVETEINAILARFASMEELMESSIATLSTFTQQLQHTSKFIYAQIEREKKEEGELLSSHLDMDMQNISNKQTFCSSDLVVASNRLSYLERIAIGIENEIKSLGSSNANETARLKCRLKEVLSDLSAAENTVIHISSCLDNR